MKNRLLEITRSSIPYIKELRPIAGSVLSVIVMQQLDYWFQKYPQGFYKFLDATPTASFYRPGQSWCEELGCTKEEFRTAFDKIGHRWHSKSQFDIAEDKFQGKFYASYVGRRTNQTFYFRNHELVDQMLDRLLRDSNKTSQEIGNPNLQEMGNTNIWKSGNPTSANGVFQSREIGNHNILYTDTTTEITENTSKLLPPVFEIYFPANFDETEKKSILKLLSGTEKEIAQNIVDEVAAMQKKGQVRQSVISLVSGLVRKVQKGTFNPALGREIARQRNHRSPPITKAVARDDLKAVNASTSKGAGQEALSEIRRTLNLPKDGVQKQR